MDGAHGRLERDPRVGVRVVFIGRDVHEVQPTRATILAAEEVHLPDAQRAVAVVEHAHVPRYLRGVPGGRRRRGRDAAGGGGEGANAAEACARAGVTRDGAGREREMPHERSLHATRCVWLCDARGSRNDVSKTRGQESSHESSRMCRLREAITAPIALHQSPFQETNLAKWSMNALPTSCPFISPTAPSVRFMDGRSMLASIHRLNRFNPISSTAA